MPLIVDIQADIARLKAAGWIGALLKDYTTGRNILWGTDAYAALGEAFARDREMLPEGLHVIEARSAKAREKQTERTRAHAEVFTPLWICRKMNGHIASEWNKKKHRWTATVDSRRLEITCGEAPFLVSRYDAASGELIARGERVGLLDEKIRLVEENAGDEREFMARLLRAFQSVYGYEFQGDNLLIARVNLLLSYEEAVRARLDRAPTAEEYRAVIRVIARNLWQMDGLTGAIPYAHAAPEWEQIDMFGSAGGAQTGLFDDLPLMQAAGVTEGPQKCKVFNWRDGHSYDITGKLFRRKKRMKFDYIIGNIWSGSEAVNNVVKPLKSTEAA